MKGIQIDLSAATGAPGILDYEAARNHQTCCAERLLRQLGNAGPTKALFVFLISVPMKRSYEGSLFYFRMQKMTSQLNQSL